MSRIRGPVRHLRTPACDAQGRYACCGAPLLDTPNMLDTDTTDPEQATCSDPGSPTC